MLKIYFGSIHARPNQLLLNNVLKEKGSEWRISVAKSIGLHSYNPKTQMCLAMDDKGYLRIPDLEEDKP